MSKTNKIQLKKSSILNVPLQSYEKDFTFIVNGEEFKTCRLISDLLSPKISKYHTIDPTFDSFTINTKYTGHFSYILQLVNFNQQDIPKSEFPFICEIISKLETTSISFDGLQNEFTKENVISNLIMHEKDDIANILFYKNEVEFISSHFYELCDESREEFKNLKVETLFDILNNDHLSLNDEDQLLHFINEMYIQNTKYSILYETVHFINISSDIINEFIEIYDVNCMTNSTWFRICERLGKEIKINETTDIKEERYKKDKQTKSKKSDNANANNGIISYLRTKSDVPIENEINLTASSSANRYKLKNLNSIINENGDGFSTDDFPNSSITLNFKNHRVIPSSYTIQMANDYRKQYPKSWVIEGSEDYSTWEIIDEKSNFSNYDNRMSINNDESHEFQYIRMRLTGPNWAGTNNLVIKSIEFYGTLI